MEINQTAPSQQSSASQSAQHHQANHQRAEEQAADFAKRLNKEKQNKAREKEGQSLASLFAEHRRHTKDTLEKQLNEQHANDGEAGKGSQDQRLELALAQGRDAQLQADLQLKEVQQTKSVKEIDAALRKLADQIQVSARDAINGAEIRISLKENVIPGTEVRIQRHGGELTVTLNTVSAESHNWLAQHEASLLKHLNDRFSNEKVQVNIHMADSGNDQQDGRSRNEYVAEENDDNQA